MAAQENNIQVVKVLLSARANANLADDVRFVRCQYQACFFLGCLQCAHHMCVLQSGMLL